MKIKAKHLQFVLILLCVITFIGYFIQVKRQNRCTKEYKIIYIEHIGKSLTGQLYATCSRKYGNELVIKRSRLIDFYTKKNGNSPIVEDGYYFIDYCIDHVGLTTIYSDIRPVDINGTFLDSIWKTYKDMELYSFSLDQRKEIERYYDTLGKSSESKMLIEVP